MLKLILVGIAATTLISCITFALPNCDDNNGQVLDINNQQVLNWKESTQNQFHGRAHVTGQIVKNYPDYTSHSHFEIQIGPQTKDTIEIVYNQEFGALPALNPGMNIETCGDYITSSMQNPGHSGSPDGAIIHWVHKNPSGQGHPSGFVAVNGTLYGY